jgi:hypothetical protein
VRALVAAWLCACGHLQVVRPQPSRPQPPSAHAESPTDAAIIASIVDPPPPRPGEVYAHFESPPGLYGCVATRTIAHGEVTTTLSCPAPYASYRSVVELELLEIDHLETTGALDRQQVYRDLHAAEPALKACFATTADVFVHGVVRGGGHAIATVEGADAGVAACLVGVLANAEIRGRVGELSCRLHYTVRDPTPYMHAPM